jgi:hypothetical protein
VFSLAISSKVPIRRGSRGWTATGRVQRGPAGDDRLAARTLEPGQPEEASRADGSAVIENSTHSDLSLFQTAKPVLSFFGAARFRSFT